MTKDDLDGGHGDLVTLVVANDDYEATLIAGRLKEAGILARLAKRGDAAGGFIYKGYDPEAPVAVLVPRAHLDQAKAVLESTDWELPSDFTAGEATHADDSDPRAEPQNLRTLWLLVAVVLMLIVLVLVGFDALFAIWDSLTGTR